MTGCVLAFLYIGLAGLLIIVPQLLFPDSGVIRLSDSDISFVLVVGPALCQAAQRLATRGSAIDAA
ncbi:hypothetical protein [Sphingopyxis sp. KK2]|uniref:hypothetical protein n=1 Tax=Sphingopyxis sp. KK2 TaxID=1855727 RepID=UPI001181967C|nr:hypothetical protein [Sphingopyxis sp. KK2]